MPVTIGRLTSHVDVVHSAAPQNDDDDRIVRRVLARLKEERYLEEQARREREIPDRMSEDDRY